MNDDYVEERELLNTKEMLEEGFLKNLSSKTKQKITKSSSELPTEVIRGSKYSIIKEGAEELLLKTYDIRDNLISSFKEIKLGSSLAQNVTCIINDLGEIIVKLGGQTEKFDPLAHVSGLQVPDFEKNASRVIENTRDSYSLGSIEDAKISDKSIIITFAGQTDNIRYKAIGTITTPIAWIGNEAIDYIHTMGEGKMFVKTFDGKNWVDKSSDYDIVWELFENPIEIVKQASTENDKKNTGKIEEVKKRTSNKLANDINDDFPIEEI